MANTKKLIQAAAGAAGGAGLNIEEVFSTYLYEGNWDGGAATTNQIVNNIDLSTEGGLVWIKNRGQSNLTHRLFDSETSSGVTGFYNLSSASTAAAGGPNTSMMSSFNSDGFTVGNNADVNSSYHAVIDYASWTFRKASKFFDVVTYTGDGTAGRTISHNLGSVPGMIIVKSTSNTYDWVVYHRGMDATAPEDYFLRLNTTAARSDTVTRWNDTAPTSTEFTVGDSLQVNGGSGQTYVAYLFAHNDGDGDFGPTGDQDIIKCGGITNAAAGVNTIDLGFEAQWVMIKRTDSVGDWYMADVMRGAPTLTLSTQRLFANTSSAESADPLVGPHPTGFQFNNQWGTTSDWVYIAIRRGPMAVPESATDVFDIAFRGTPETAPPTFNSGFVTDFAIWANTGTAPNEMNYRLSQNVTLDVDTNASQHSQSSRSFDYMDGFGDFTGTNTAQLSWMWKRAPNFCDVVAYTGNGTAGRTVSHNLGVAPEMMWVKERSGSNDWIVYHSGVSNSYGRITTAAFTSSNVGYYFGNNDQTLVSPTDSVFTIGGTGAVNGSGQDFIAFLFASLDGVSKVGSYTGNGSLTGPSIDCGFSAGPRFVLIKRTDSAENWYLFDSERGIVAGADPYLMLNSTSAEINAGDLIDPTSSGFQLATNGSNVNASGGTYIFYAIA